MTSSLHSPAEAASWLRSRVTGGLWADSRKLGAGDGFIAWPGAAVDARKYVGDVLAAGASACLVEEDGAAAFGFSDERVATYAGLKTDAAPVASAYFGEPSRQLQVIAVTGTNGKTSSAWWLAQALGKLGRRCGVVGTLGIGEPGAMVFNGLTTPDPVLLQQQLRHFADEGYEACALEASSIGIAEHRLDATRIEVAVFTNFTQDHLDYHGSMADYWAAKQKLFSWPGLKSAVVNVDDLKGAELQIQLTDSGLDVWSVSIGGAARIRAENVEQRNDGMIFDVVEGDQRAPVVAIGTVGIYNVSNLLGVIGALRAVGIPLAEAVAACGNLSAVPGRLETVSVEGQPLVAVDYAHTPDALSKVLGALRPVAQGRGGRLWCVFGCGGDRDPTKRPLMAAAAQKNADRIVVTSDNPRNENPSNIISQMLLGLTHCDTVHVEANRALAILQTLSLADPVDVVLIAGKGHEDYQDIAGVKHPFSDRAHAEAALASRASGGAAS